MNNLKIIRTMPNTPMQVGEGCTVYTPGRYVTNQDLEKTHLILNSLGIAQQVPEKMINSIAGLSGCGPAYVSFRKLVEIDGNEIKSNLNHFIAGVYSH